MKGIKTTGFRALMTTQFLGAFNDNAFKFVIAALMLDFIDKSGGSSLLLSLSGVLFILPFILFSTFAGFFADRLSKRKIIISAKAFEIFVMSFGLWALYNGNIWFLLSVLFFMGLQSTFFSPSKYGILPEILDDKELSEGNGAIQMWTYVAILLGQASFGFLKEWTEPHHYKMAYFFISVSVIGFITSLFVTKVEPSGTHRPVQFNFIKEIVQNVKWLKGYRPIFLSIVGLMYFGFLGGLFQLNILLYARQTLMISDKMASFLMASLTVGIGFGCFLAGKLSDRKVELGLVPMGAIGLSIFSITLGFVTQSYVNALIVVFLLGISSGFYIVPLNALLQQQSPQDRRGQVLATNNFLTFSSILVGSLSLTLLRDVVQLNAAQIFIFLGLTTIIGTTIICRLLPYYFVRFLVWMLTHSFYKIKVLNRSNVPEKGGALLVSNHISYIDALLVLVTIQRPIRFLVYRNIYNIKILKPLFKLARAIPLSENDNPKEIVKSLKEASQALRDGELVCIFAEGQLSRTGNLLKFKKGFERIIKGIDCPIIPVHLDRVWGSIFSYEGGKYFFKMPKVLPYPVTVAYGQPLASDTKSFEVRNRVRELGADAFEHRLSQKMTLIEAFWQEARRFPMRKCMSDTLGMSLSYGKTLVSTVALSDTLKQKVGQGQHVGILLPPSVPAALTNLSVSILNKVPVNLNYTTSQESLNAIIDQCDMSVVLTSRKFLEKVKLEIKTECIYVEDIFKDIPAWTKMKAIIKSFLIPSVLSHRVIFGKKTNRNMQDLATIMFTSGSTGLPKGVMLTQANVMSNLEGLYQTFPIKNKDVMLGVLPFFHSFGFTATIWFPLISGMGAVYHNNPLDAKGIGQLVQKHKATILMSTPTFLNAYTRRCTEEQFASLRIVTVGAEKLKEPVAKAFEDKFGVEPMEGYGCTELSPVVSMNLPNYKQEGVFQRTHKYGKIGLPLPGVAVKVLHTDSLAPVGPEENGLLFVKGPNVMKGYLNNEKLTNEVVHDGWYKTGDVANIDEDGFIKITDRLSRFSKIGGEMVPHIKIEETIQNILDESEQKCIVTSLPDEKKGEKLAVICTQDVDINTLVQGLQNSDLPKLWIPDASMFHVIETLPLLGTGKIDLATAKKVAQEAFNRV